MVWLRFDEEMVIQIDATAVDVDGITPDLRVSLTEENVCAMYVEGVDIVLEYAIDAVEDSK